MKAQGTTVDGWTILADFTQTLGVALATGVFVSLLAGLLVYVVSILS